MGRFLHHLNTVLNVVFIAAAGGVAVLAVLSLVKGPTLHYAPYIFALGGIYYLAAALKVFAEEGRHRVLKGCLRILLALVLAALTFITYRSLG